MEKLGVIYVDIDIVIREYFELVKEYFGIVVSNKDNKYVVLNVVVWLGGLFIYVFKGVCVEKLL